MQVASDLESNPERSTQQSTHLHPYNYYILLNSNKSSCAISASNKNLSQTFQSLIWKTTQGLLGG